MELFGNLGKTVEALGNHISFDDEGNYSPDDYIVNEITRLQITYGITSDLNPENAKTIAYNTTCLIGFVLNEVPKRYCNGMDLYQWIYAIARNTRNCGKIENPRKLWDFVVGFVEKYADSFAKCSDPEGEICHRMIETIKKSPDE